MSCVTPSRRFNRRDLVSGSLIGATALVGASVGQSFAQSATPGPATPVGDSSEYLAVADQVAETLSIYRLPDLALIARLEGVNVNAHAGLIPLPGGQLLFMDGLGKRLMSVGVDADHLHVDEAMIPGTAFSHIAIDSDRADYAAVGSDDPAAPVTLVDLHTWETVPVAIPEPGEVGLFLAHDYLFHRNNNLNQIEAYALEAILDGEVEAVSTVQIGTGGHGESRSLTGDRLYTATDDGIDVVAWDGTALTFLTTYSWDSTDRQGGRGYFQRLSLDGGTVVSYTADRSAPEEAWATWTNDAVLIDTDEGVTHRIELGKGYVYRFGLAHDRALFYRIGADGDEAIMLDLANAEISQRIPLGPMRNGPVAGESIYDVNQYRAITMTTDGRWGFVTQGGDGLVVALDLETGTIGETIDVGSPLDGGGYLGIFGTPDSFSDTIGR